MIQEIIATGRDVNAAIDSGCQQLGIDREEDTFDFEIIAMEKKGFLGLKTYPAKVRVFREVPDPKPPKPIIQKEPEKPKPAPAPQSAALHERPAGEKKPAQRPAPASDGEIKEPGETGEKRETQSSQETRKEREPRRAREKKPREPKEAREAKEKKPPREPRPRREQAADVEDTQPTPLDRPSQTEVEPTDNVRERVERSAAYVEKILGIMGIGDVKVTPRYYEDNVCLQLTGTGLGVIIGRRGETLDAVQYLSSLVANRGEGDYIRVNIDSGNYREKRERTLEALAKKLANNAVRTGKSTTLEPMNPYERRVIHGAVAQVRGATSSSIGVDPNRRVVISSASSAPTRRYDEGGGRGRSRDDRRREGGRGRRDDRKGYRSSRSEARNEENAEPRPPRPKLDDGPAPERVYAPKPAEPVAPPPKLVEFTQEEREVTEKTSLYGKIEL